MFAFIHKSLQEFNVASEVVASVKRALQSSGMTPAELTKTCESITAVEPAAADTKDERGAEGEGQSRQRRVRNRSFISKRLVEASRRADAAGRSGGGGGAAADKDDTEDAEAAAAARRRAGALQTLSQILGSSALASVELAPEEANRAFLVDAMLGHLSFPIALRAGRRFCAVG